ncbi:MAG: UPF0182 family protein [Jatrophihabitans sp.]
MPSMILSRRAKIALSVVGTLVVLLIVLIQLAGTYVDYQWFGEVQARGVFTTILWTKVSLFMIFGVLMALIIGANLVVAYLIKPPFRPMSPEQQNLQNYVVMLEPRRRFILIVTMAIAFLSAGASAQGDWESWQLWLNGGSFGTKDPLFGLDVSFFAWDYPVYRLILSFGFTAVIFSLILVVGIHYLTGAIRLQTPGPKVTVAARRQITILVFVFMLLKAAAYWLDRYGLVFSERSKFTGASYTDVHSALPAKTILFWITLILAIGVLASLWLRSTLLPGIGFVVLLVLSILIGGIYPAVVQKVSVQPNASTKEAPYIRDNLESTRQAYDIVLKDKQHPNGTVTQTGYDPINANAKQVLQATNNTVANLRILDPNVLSPTFTQQQAQQKNFYGFPPKLDVDRYTVDGVTNDYIVGVRELSAAKLSGDQTNWINEHTNYTHGFGFVSAKADTNVADSTDYADGGIPQSGSLNVAAKLSQPRAYYGELVSDYAIVGAKGSPREFDGKGGAKYTYDGKGGISLSNPFTRLAFALDYKEPNFLLNSTASADGARVMINRDPRQRVAKVAPFLKIDGDPYPFVDSQTGHILWMLDGYTTMANFPYSQRRSLSDLTADSLTKTAKTAGQADTQINYIRNSVKATVDAYDGTVHLYQWDKQDPILKAWENIFPGLVEKNSAMPADVREHVRYPEDLFSVQRSLLEQYHVTDPTTYYNTSDKWTIPSDPAQDGVGDQPPYYVLADPPNSDSNVPQFQLTSPMKVNDKQNLAAYISVNSDSDGYGQMTILRLPTGTVIQGPEQVNNYLNTDDNVASYIKLQQGNNNTIIEGNLLTLPIGNTFLFVEPLYVQAKKDGSFPLLRGVLAYFGSKVGFGATLNGALDDLRLNRRTGSSIDEISPSTPGGGPVAPSPTPSSSPSSGPGASSSSPPGNLSVTSLLGQLQQAQTNLNAAYDTHDPQTIADAQVKRDKLVDELLQARTQTKAPPSPKSTPSPSPRK